MKFATVTVPVNIDIRYGREADGVFREALWSKAHRLIGARQYRLLGSALVFAGGLALGLLL